MPVDGVSVTEHKGHNHTAGGANERKLLWAIGLTGTFLIAEVIGGLLSGSLALLSDAAHMLTDVMALVVAVVAIKMGKREADHKRTYGYRRFEILAAIFNAVVLFLVALYILYEAYGRFMHPPEIETGGMLGVAVIGLVVNLISMKILQSGSESSLNMKGAYLEVLSDMLGSVGVIIGAILIYYTGWRQIDSILAVLIGLWVLPRTWKLLSESLNILLEGVPADIDLQKLHTELAALPNVEDVHDLHVWAITSGKNSLTVHLVVKTPQDGGTLMAKALEVVKKYGIDHANFQVEAQGHTPKDLTH
ncbi:MAG: cation diffusion facilitator family transporter [Rickettsiales bacterium]|nr:cation diffusion facilitator family transporter [Rickettsiales bacterium]